VIQAETAALPVDPSYELCENNHFTTHLITTPNVGMRVPCLGHGKKVCAGAGGDQG
jgi:hypothetical protein